jgi:DNA invertase Pin-like site-specific DNA recombinase
MQQEPHDPQLAVIYCRMSEDREGGGLGIDRQREDCEQLAASLGLKVLRVYPDNDLSAYSGKPRPQYRQMLEDLRNGAAGVVIAWHTDRLHRSPVELEEYIDICEPRRIDTRTVKAGHLDLTTATGRMIARQLGVQARYEVERMIERQRRAREQKVERGEYCGGPRPYGWEGDGVTPVPEEVAVIRESCEAILAGASARSVALDLNRRKLFTSTGSEWEGGSLSRMLRRPRNAGIIQFRGEEGGVSKWDGAVDEATWRSVLGVLNDPSRMPTASNVRKWLGSGLYQCGECSGLMASHHAGSEKVPLSPKYRCKDERCVTRDAVKLDQHVQHVLLRRLQRKDAPALFARAEPVADVDRAQKDMRAARALLDELARSLGAGEMDMQEWRGASAGAKQRLTVAEGVLSSAVQVNPLARLFGAEDIVATWGVLDLSEKRSAVDFAMTVRVMPATSGRKKGGSYWDPSAIQILWK